MQRKFSSSMNRLLEWQFDTRRNMSWAQCLDKRLERPKEAGEDCVPDFAQEDYHNIPE